MGKGQTKKMRRSGMRPAFMEPVSTVCDTLSGQRDGARSGASATGDSVQDVSNGFGSTARPCAPLASELFARLLLELPGHRRDLLSACQDGNEERLARAAHKLLGGVVYCELADLAAALRELKQTLGSGDSAQTAASLGKAVRIIDELLACSGYRGT
jgi:hypothetical protein